MRKRSKGQSSALMKTLIPDALTLIAMLLTVSSCSERMHFIPEIDDGDGIPVTINVASLEQEPFGTFHTKGTSDLKEACSVINYAIYNMSDGKLDKQVNQKASDDVFGTLSLKLEEGSYRLVVIAHNGDANATMTDRNKIQFQNNNKRRITDTFLYSSDITVVKDMEPLNLNLDRVVAKVELCLVGDSIPPSVATMEFEIGLGGSSGLNTANGYGTRSTKYTEKFSVVPGDTLVEVYTFVYEGSETTKMTVVAKDADGSELKKIQIENIPIARNRITRYKGVLFGKESINAQASVNLNNVWAGMDEFPLTN